jgi:hypothetical protein
MSSLRQIWVAGFVCLKLVTCYRHNDYAEISLHQVLAANGNLSAHDGPCAASCSRMSPDIFWKLASDTTALMAKADENCVSPNCKGCRRATKGLHKTTMPDCSAPTQVIAAAEVEQSLPKPDQQTPEEQTLGIPAPREVVPQDIPLSTPIDPCMRRAEPDEVCDYANTAWCLAPSRNVGDTCRKGGKPLCCSKIAVVAARVAVHEAFTYPEDRSSESLKPREDTPETVSEMTEPSSPIEIPVPVKDEGDVCADGDFAFERISRGGSTLQVCRNIVSKRFAKKICCDERLKQELAEKEAAINACAEYFKHDNNHCRGDRFETKRSKTKYTKVPLSYTCKVQYLCKDASGEITFGPVVKLADCGDRKLTGHSTCVAVKK